MYTPKHQRRGQPPLSWITAVSRAWMHGERAGGRAARGGGARGRSAAKSRRECIGKAAADAFRPSKSAPHLGKFGAILADFIASVPPAVSSEEPTVIRGAAATTTLLCCCCTETRCWRYVQVYWQHWQPPGGLQDALPARGEVLQEEVRGAPTRCCARRHAAIVERRRINCPHHSTSRPAGEN